MSQPERAGTPLVRPRPGIATLADVRVRCIIDAVSGCWIWQRARSSDGAPRIFTFDYRAGDKRTMTGTRAVWQIAHGAAPLAGYLIYRGCGNNSCLNPVHLREMPSRKAIGLHQARAGYRKGTQIEQRRAAIVLGLKARGITPTPDAAVEAIRNAPAVVTNKELAALLGVGQQSVSMIRRGRRRAGVGSAAAAADGAADRGAP